MRLLSSPNSRKLLLKHLACRPATANFLYMGIESSKVFAESTCASIRYLFLKRMDVCLDLTEILVLLGAFLYLLAIGLEAATLAQVEENTSEFTCFEWVIERAFAKEIEGHLLE